MKTPAEITRGLHYVRHQDTGAPHDVYELDSVDGTTHRTSAHSPSYYACGRKHDRSNRLIGPSRDGMTDFSCLTCRDRAHSEFLEWCRTAPTRICIQQTSYGLNYPEDMSFYTTRQTLLILSRHRNWLRHRQWVQFARKHPDLVNEPPWNTRVQIMFWIHDEAQHLDAVRTWNATPRTCLYCHVTEPTPHTVECRYREASFSQRGDTDGRYGLTLGPQRKR